MSPTTIWINGDKYVETNDGWKNDRDITIADCEDTAKRLSLYARGVDANIVICRIINYINGSIYIPVWGKDIVDSFEHEEQGSRDQLWTEFFKYIYNNYAICRYKRVSKKTNRITIGSWVFFAFPEQIGNNTIFTLPHYGKRIHKQE